MPPRWRNIVALLLALAFAPSSVLAAMPVVWCVGADGHRAVEFSLGSSAGHADHRALGEHRSATDEAGAQDACLDRQLLDDSKVSAPGHDGIVSFDLRAVVVLPSVPHEGSERPPRRSLLEPLLSRADAQLAAHRSIVLLI